MSDELSTENDATVKKVIEELYRTSRDNDRKIMFLKESDPHFTNDEPKLFVATPHGRICTCQTPFDSSAADFIVHQLFNKPLYGFVDEKYADKNLWGVFKLLDPTSATFRLYPYEIRFDGGNLVRNLQEPTLQDTKFSWIEASKIMYPLQKVPTEGQEEANESDEAEGDEDESEASKVMPASIEQILKELRDELQEQLLLYMQSFDYKIFAHNLIAQMTVNALITYLRVLVEATLKYHATFDDPEVFYKVLTKRNFSYKERRLRRIVWDFTSVKLSTMVSFIENNLKLSIGRLNPSEAESLDQAYRVLKTFLCSMHVPGYRDSSAPLRSDT